MTRRLANWLESYTQYASVSESPKMFHIWAGVSAIAGALRRHCWFDQIKFKWYPNFYIVFVGPPGIVTKSTTADGSISLLREVPGIHFGPDEITWQALVTAFTKAHEEFQVGGEGGDYYPQSALTIVASEFGMYMDFRDTKMVNLHITLWDGLNKFEKETKMSGNDSVNAPWINLIACTTPSWISQNMTEATIGGGFTSRCVFVYGEKKERPVAYIEDMINFDYGTLRDDLIHDLEWISTHIYGQYRLTHDAKEWGKAWYDKLWSEVYNLGNADWVNNYLARKQAHMHKLAMVLAASKTDAPVIDLTDLQLANHLLSTTEESAAKVFEKVGRTEESIQADKLLQLILLRTPIPFSEVFKLAQVHFPNGRDFDGIMHSFVQAGQLRLVVQDGVPTVIPGR